MILVTRINGREQYYLNEDHIEQIEETPDTILTLISGRKYVVLEPVGEIKKRICEEKRNMWKYINFREAGGDGIDITTANEA